MTSIAAVGLLQPLVVRKTNRGKFAVIAGQRRYLALSALAERGTISPDAPVPCSVMPGTVDAAEISLTENVVRAPMHPADQFEAFRDLVDSGSTPADIAARFGITEIAVRQRLKLARVCTAVFEAYRKADLTLEQVQALAISDDHAAQERLFNELSQRNGSPANIRAVLTQDEIGATDKRVRYVTLAAYEAEGGALRRDLFAEGEKGMFVLDAQLLDRLAMEKLTLEAETVKAEGWKWVEMALELDRSEMDFRVRRPEPLPLSEEAEAEHSKLSAEYTALFDSADEHDEETSERLDAIEERITELEDTESAYTPDVLAIAGAFVTIGRDGKLEVMRGLVRPEDEPEAEETADSSSEKVRPEFSAKLVQSLTAARSAAIGLALSGNPAIALAAVTHGLAMSVFNSYSEDGRLQVSGKVTKYSDESKGASELTQSYEQWAERLPGEPAALFTWCLEQEQSTLLELLAFCAACTVNAVTAKQGSDSRRIAHADALASALNLDMAHWFTPTAENYFGRVGREQIVSAICEAKGTLRKRSWGKLKKSELAALAEREVAGTSWLPKLLAA
jgi:ParB family chromosome partitioning protein